MASAVQPELVFVVDVSSLTKKGFVGTTTYEGRRVDLEFDDEGEGVFLSAEMAKRLHVRKGSLLVLLIEGERNDLAESDLASVGRVFRFSNHRVYYAFGREGGAVIRVRKAQPRATE